MILMGILVRQRDARQRAGRDRAWHALCFLTWCLCRPVQSGHLACHRFLYVGGRRRDLCRVGTAEVWNWEPFDLELMPLCACGESEAN